MSEADVKAALVYNIALFIDWPASPRAESGPFVVGVLGDDAAGEALSAVLAGKRIHDRPMTVRRWADLGTARAHLRECQMLYVAESSPDDPGRVIAALGDAPVLSVSGLRGFAAAGGHVELYLEANRVRFQINPTAAERSGLRVSSKLLGLARLTPRSGD